MTLAIEHLYKRFPSSEQDVLQDIDIETKDGEFICIIGPSGCGKSTLLNLIAGLDFPTSGTINLNGTPVTSPGADRVVMFQEATLFPWLNVIDNVQFGLKIAKMPKKERMERALHYLDMVQLSRFSEYMPHELSGGMKQRVALARSMACGSDILLMDEPFSSLDKQTKNKLCAEVQQIFMKNRKTVIFVTHSVEEAIFFADWVIIISRRPGKILRKIKVNFPRPRHIEDPDFIKLRAGLLEEVRNETEKSYEDEYD